MHRSTSEIIVRFRETIGDIPPPLVGSQTALTGSKLYLFGGSLASASKPRLLSDLRVFDLELCRWERISPSAEDPVPKERYFHTMDIWNNHLTVFGGLGMQGNNPQSDQLQVLNDVRMFDLSSKQWLPPPRVAAVSPLTPVPRARYGHLSCVSSNQLFIIGGKGFFGEALNDVCVYDLAKKEWIKKQPHVPSSPMNHAVAFTSLWHIRTQLADPRRTEDPDAAAQHALLPYSERATKKSPRNIFLYHTDPLQSKLEAISPLPNNEIHMKNLSGQLPCLRFPSGGILGNTLILAGSDSDENANHTFFIWTLDLATNIWACIDTGERLKNRLWAKGFMWHAQDKFVVFGNRASVVDAAQRLRLVLSWDAVAIVDLEALGIYQPPTRKSNEASQRVGLASLADARWEDFAFLCEDQRDIPCSRKIVAARWPWFHEQHTRLCAADANNDSITHGKRTQITVTITRNSCALSQSYPVTLALLQYFYSLSLSTSLQHAPAVLSSLLLISTEFRIPHLHALVKHAMHCALTADAAAGMYEIAASCGCRSLQIRWVHDCRPSDLCS
ncbi:galactose oxidase [Mycena crocata]|nr:galactose oxidase [Mycena crocata]